MRYKITKMYESLCTSFSYWWKSLKLSEIILTSSNVATVGNWLKEEEKHAEIAKWWTSSLTNIIDTDNDSLSNKWPISQSLDSLQFTPTHRSIIILSITRRIIQLSLNNHHLIQSSPSQSWIRNLSANFSIHRLVFILYFPINLRFSI